MLSQFWHTHGARVLALLSGLLLLIWAISMLFAPYQPSINIPTRAFEPAAVAGLYPTELSSEDGLPFRWSDGRARMVLPRQGARDHLVSLLLAAPLPESRAVMLQVNSDTPIPLTLRPETRRYLLIAPAAALRWDRNQIVITSPEITPPGETRRLGVVLVAAGWAALQSDWPLLPTVQLIALLLACASLAAVLQMIPAHPRFATVALFLVISVVLQHSDLRFEQRVAAALLSIGIAVVFTMLALLLRRFPSAAIPPPQAPVGTPRSWLLPLGGFLVLALITFAPLLLHLGTLVYGPPGDNFEYLWKIAWVAESITTRRASPLFQPDFFFPAGFDVARSELTPAHTLPGALLSLILGPVAAYNLLLIGATLLTCWFTALLAELLGAPRLGAMVAGVGVGFCAFRIFYALGTLPMASTQWVILAIYGWERFLQRRQASDVLIAGLGIALAAWSSWYYGATLPLLLLLYTCVRLPLAEWRTLLRQWQPLVPGMAASAALLLPYAQPYQALSPPPHGRAELLQLSAQPLGYLLPNPFQIAWGPTLLSWTYAHGLTERVSIGVGLALLASIGLWQTRRQRASIALLITGVVWFILSLGPQLQIGTLTIPMPVELIYQHVPGLKSIRVWSRMAFYVQLTIGLLASMALIGYTSHPRWKQILISILVGMVLIESVSASPWRSETAPRPVEQWLAAQPRGAVLHVPDTLSGWHEYQTLATHQPLVAGYGTFYPAAFLIDYFALQGFPGGQTLDAVRRLQPRYLVVNSAMLDPVWEPIMLQQPDFREVYRDPADPHMRVFRFEPTVRP
jgi:hypothetical protein